MLCDAWSCMESMSVSLCRCCMSVSCVHQGFQEHRVVVLNAAFCMTCSLLMLVEDGRATTWKRHTPEPVSGLSYR